MCMGSSCFSKGNKDVAQKIIQYITANHLDKQIQVQGCLCRGLCKDGPVVEIKGKTYSNVSAETVESLLKTALEGK